MKPFLVFVASWLAAGAGALVGSVLGNAAGKTGLFVGGAVGGAIGVSLAVLLARRLGWLPPRETTGALTGGVLGFAVAVPVTLTHMGTPVIPVLSCAVVGIGVMIGAAVARRSTA